LADPCVDDLKELEKADYSHPKLLCDIVMKGGITSGVTYPWAVCELAQRYRLRNVGGTSAGAIAAATAAAAEVGRANAPGSAKAGFPRLAGLPTRLSATTSGDKNSVLFNLFQPNDSTRRYFRILAASLGGSKKLDRKGSKKKPSRKLGKMLVAAVAGAPVAAAMGASVGLSLFVLLLWLAVAHENLDGDAVAVSAIALGLIAAVIVTVVGTAAVLLASLAKGAMRDLVGNGFGMCKGYIPAKKIERLDDPDQEQRDGRDEPKPLTTWLADELDALAAKQQSQAREPLTLGDLAKKGVNLKMFTTNLTEGTPYTLPFRTPGFYFDTAAFRQYFPERVVKHMEDSVKETLSDADRALIAAGRTSKPPLELLPLPDAENMPVIVVTRFSLSFPVLLSAVPLWRASFDAAGQPHPQQHWFSDGGITSNFPIHFFDSPLPRWPTFGINLGPAGSEPLDPNDQSKNIWTPKTNDEGSTPRWSGISSLPQFGQSILDTMQNWMDNAQTKVPGFRDRIVLIKHDKDEGGMNLNMPADFICNFARRGREAGKLLARRFAVVDPTNPEPLSWENHRWVRFRSVMPLVEDLMSKLARGYAWPPAPGPTKYPDLIAEPHTYAEWRKGSGQLGRVEELMPEVLQLATGWTRPKDPPPTDPEGFVPIEAILAQDPIDLKPYPAAPDEKFDPDKPFLCEQPRPRPTIRIVRDF